MHSSFQKNPTVIVTCVFFFFLKKKALGTSLGDQWLSDAGGAGLIPSQETKVPHAMRCGQIFFLKLLKKFSHIPLFAAASKNKNQH